MTFFFMGSRISHLRRMNERYESDSDGMDRDSDSDRDIATILQYLIRSGQVRIVTSGGQVGLIRDSSLQDDSDEEQSPIHAPPKIDRHPDTSRLKNNDLRQSMLLYTGALNDQRRNAASVIHPLPSMLNRREVGMSGRSHFTRGDCCQISQRILPNKMDVIDNSFSKVFCGTFARDGDVFMSASQDFYIRLYDSRDERFKKTKVVEARDVGWSILDVAVSPDGCSFAYCSWSDCIHLCNISGDHEVHQALPLCPEDSRFCLFSMRFSQDGREILGGANDECLYVYNREENKRTLKIHSHEDDVNTVAFADNTSQILFSAGDDGICKVWDRRALSESDPKPVGILVGHEDGITYVDPKGDGRYLITNSKDQTIKLWDMRAFSPASGVNASRRAVALHNWDYRWQRVPSSLNRTKRRMHGDTSLMTYRGHSVLQTLIRCHFSPEFTTGQSYIYTGCAQGQVVVYDVLTGKIKIILNGHRACVRDVTWHPYRNEIMTSSWDGTVGRWTYKCFDSESAESNAEKSPAKSENETPAPRRSLRLLEQKRKQFLEKSYY